jgi:hypothetical protein
MTSARFIVSSVCWESPALKLGDSTNAEDPVQRVPETDAEVFPRRDFQERFALVCFGGTFALMAPSSP